MWADLDCDQCMGSFRPNQNDYVFSVILLTRVRTDSGKVWKVMEVKVEIFQVWKIMENDLRYGKVWKVMEFMIADLEN